MRFATLETACLRAICCGKKATRCVGVSVCVCWCTHNTHTHTLTHTHTQVYQQAQKCQHMPLRMRRLEEARDLYSRAHKTDANSVAALTNLAAVDMALGDHEVAVGHCDDAIATAKRVRAKAKLLARAYERKGKAMRACKRFKEARAAVREAQEREGGGGKTEEGGRGDGGGGGKGGQGGEGKASAEFVSVDMKEEIKVRKQVCNLACMHIHTHIRMNERQVWWNRFRGLWNRTNLSNFNN
jgi:hypothetical protein